ncbi:TetR/AcrR family transcriptional regulator [Phytohabitans suffuscus]|uniref:HTH tetR-type domain-containing protein n=1 Tax=Phytohabitans suffuscus TaxID=624315 RepID=A0A6F8YSK3_9ACTN|nr:TetR/AcrR family transcriptional regulator [Phytohabitans suffuscus]BCB88811.1 hypothetical protein Psuf_061240 [Phytohabitans suffuscus]
MEGDSRRAGNDVADRQLDRAAIIAAARRLLERDGVGRFSIRKLAAALGSKPMTLYHYVPSKAALFNLVLGEAAAEITWPTPSGPPRERMITLALGLHERLAAYPWVIPILQTGTQLGASAIVVTDRFLAAALEAGATDRQALSLWRAVWYLVSTDLTFRARLAGLSPDERPWYETDVVDHLPEAPTVTALIPHWAAASADYRVEESITAIVDGSLHHWAPAD